MMAVMHLNITTCGYWVQQQDLLVDEIHACDAWMSRILEGLIETAGQ